MSKGVMGLRFLSVLLALFFFTFAGLSPSGARQVSDLPDRFRSCPVSDRGSKVVDPELS